MFLNFLFFLNLDFMFFFNLFDHFFFLTFLLFLLCFFILVFRVEIQVLFFEFIQYLVHEFFILLNLSILLLSKICQFFFHLITQSFTEFARWLNYKLLTLIKKWSNRAAIAHLFAKYRDIFPLFFPIALPIKEVLKSRPYLGVLVFCFNALNNAFSAPKICMVEAGYFAKVLKDPECAISLAATLYPIRVVKLGETISILFFKYYCIYFLY